MNFPTAETTDEDALWRAWRSGKDGSARDSLIRLHQEFARIIAAKLYARRYSDEVEFDEYLQFARVGLLESVDRYDPDLGANFRTFSAHRMQGAILSGLECLSECNRQVAMRQHMQRERLSSLAAQTDEATGDAFDRLASVAIGLAVGFMLDDVAAYQSADGSYEDNAYSALAARQTRQRLVGLIEQLPAKEAKIIRHHYLQQVSFDEIARSMELTPGRISQLHRRALMTLRALLKADALDLVL